MKLNLEKTKYVTTREGNTEDLEIEKRYSYGNKQIQVLG